MTIFSKMIEDPFYDEDGQLIDEDSDEGDWEDDVPAHTATFDPYDTVNS
jgi:hypothetical protein